MTEFFSTIDPSAACAIYGLLWFVLGILAGRLTVSRAQRGGNRRPAPEAARAPQSPNRRGNKACEVYVGNLSYDMSEKEIMELFGRYGKVVSARLIENKFNGKSKGFGFVEMADRDGMEAAVRALQGKEIKGRKIVVNEAKSKARD